MGRREMSIILANSIQVVCRTILINREGGGKKGMVCKVAQAVVEYGGLHRKSRGGYVT